MTAFMSATSIQPLENYQKIKICKPLSPLPPRCMYLYPFMYSFIQIYFKLIHSLTLIHQYSSIGTHFFAQFLTEYYWKKKKVKSLSRVPFFGTPWTVAYQAPPSWDFPGKSTGVGCLSFSGGPSQPRNWTWVSHIAGRRFTVWTTLRTWQVQQGLCPVELKSRRGA